MLDLLHTHIRLNKPAFLSSVNICLAACSFESLSFYIENNRSHKRTEITIMYIHRQSSDKEKKTFMRLAVKKLCVYVCVYECVCACIWMCMCVYITCFGEIKQSPFPVKKSHQAKTKSVFSIVRFGTNKEIDSHVFSYCWLSYYIADVERNQLNKFR